MFKFPVGLKQSHQVVLLSMKTDGVNVAKMLRKVAQRHWQGIMAVGEGEWQSISVARHIVIIFSLSQQWSLNRKTKNRKI